MSVREEPPVAQEDSGSHQDTLGDRGTPLRSTVARKCREFYLRRLERTETLQRRWSVDSPTSGLTFADQKMGQVTEEDSSGVESEGSTCSEVTTRRRTAEIKTVKRADSHGDLSAIKEQTDNGSDPPQPLRKWNSTFDLAMDNLRREITSLIAQDNDLFRQLLSLNDSIAELRDQQKRNLELSQLDDDDDDDDEFDGSRSPSLESLSDPDTSATTPSPASTLSSCCSSHYAPNNGSNCGNNITRRPALPPSMRTSNYHHHHHRHHHHESSSSRPRSSCSNMCLRCHSSSSKMAAPMPLLRRRAHSQASLHWKRDDFDSYDSGIYLPGSHSDSDHEIFV